VLRTRRGDSDAYGELVRRYQAPVFNVCYRLAGERREAKDWAQEAFIRAYERLETFDSRLPFGPWIGGWPPTGASTGWPATGPAVALDGARRADSWWSILRRSAAAGARRGAARGARRPAAALPRDH
jgi:hypothetical protein